VRARFETPPRRASQCYEPPTQKGVWRERAACICCEEACREHGQTSRASETESELAFELFRHCYMNCLKVVNSLVRYGAGCCRMPLGRWYGAVAIVGSISVSGPVARISSGGE
jgi:hypothetical protein